MIRNLSIVLAVIACFCTSCSNKRTTKIEVMLQGNKEMSTIFLHKIKNFDLIAGYSQKESNMILIDSVKSISNIVTFTPKLEDKNSLYRLSFVNGFAPEKVIFLDLKEGDEVKVKCNPNDAFTYSLEGNANNKAIQRAMKAVGAMYSEITPMWIQMHDLNKLSITENNLSKRKTELLKQLDEIYRIQNDTYLNLVERSFEVNDYAGLVALNMLYYLPLKPSMLKLLNKINTSTNDSLIKKYLLNRVENVKKILKERESSQLLKGKKLPDLRLIGVDGKEFNMSEKYGKLTLIDFWASWCGPCVSSNNHILRPLYEKYHKLGFEVIGVSLDNSKTKWTECIENNSYKWVHGVKSDTSVNLNSTYFFRTIPYTILVDQNGTVLDVKVEGTNLEEKIKEILE